MTSAARPRPASGGLFATFEGVDGAGKSTQLRLAAEALRARGLDVRTTREPGGSPGAEEIRHLLVTGAPGRWSAETELLLFTAARRDHWERTIAPALAEGAVILCDRFVDSTRAYQIAGRGASADTLETLHRLMINREADVTLIYDLDPAAARARGADAREDRYERFGADFHAVLRQAFLDIAAASPERCRVIDASGAPEAVAAETVRHLEAALGTRSEAPRAGAPESGAPQSGARDG